MTNARAECLKRVAGRILGLSPGHPVRVAVDGRTASGKSTLATELAQLLEASGRAVIRTSIDAFHRPAAERHRRGRFSAEGYYRDARDLSAAIDLLLRPLGAGGNRRYATASFDLDSDKPVEAELQIADADSVLLFDGTFLQRPELAGCFDFAIFVDVPATVARVRGVARDSAMTGDIAAAEALYDRRYAAAFDLYLSEVDPTASADVLFDNCDFESPGVSFGSG